MVTKVHKAIVITHNIYQYLNINGMYFYLPCKGVAAVYSRNLYSNIHGVSLTRTTLSPFTP